MFVSRSSLEKPRPLERFSRTTSPSSTSTREPRSRSSFSTICEIVVLPAPESPVNQSVKPFSSAIAFLCVFVDQDLSHLGAAELLRRLFAVAELVDVEVVEDLLGVVGAVVVADAGMVAAHDEVGAAVVAAGDRMEDRLAR